MLCLTFVLHIILSSRPRKAQTYSTTIGVVTSCAQMSKTRITSQWGSLAMYVATLQDNEECFESHDDL